MRTLPCGDVGLLVELADLDEVLGLYRRLTALDLDGVEALVPASRTLLVRIDPDRTSPEAIDRALGGLTAEPTQRPQGAAIEVPVVYDGDDLDEVGELTGLGAEGVIAAHTGQVWTVGFVGFAPGFGYLVAEDERLRVPRRSHPRPAVPVGAVGLADGFSGVYPRRSPGGWQLIGRTDLPVWDVTREPPGLLQPGAAVRFVAVR